MVNFISLRGNFDLFLVTFISESFTTIEDELNNAGLIWKKHVKDICFLILIQVCLIVKHYLISYNNEIIQFTIFSLWRTTDGIPIKTFKCVTYVIGYLHIYIWK